MDETKEVVQVAAGAVTDVAKATADVALSTVGATVQETRKLLHLDDLLAYVTVGNISKLVVSLLSILIFCLVYFIGIKKLILKGKLLSNTPENTKKIVERVFSYAFKILLAMYVLSLFGIKLSAIWGAAGVAGLAIGFAAQTSVSNLISGIFVLTEKVMKKGDYVTIGGESGVVDSIGLLSVKIHTLDNQMIRIPNSTVINGTLTNYNSFDKRRFVFDVGVSYDSDLDKVLEALQKVPGMCPSVRQEPAPAVFYDGLGDSAIDVKIAVWFDTPNLIQVKNEVYKAIMKVSRETPFEIPYSQVDLHFRNDLRTLAATK